MSKEQLEFIFYYFENVEKAVREKKLDPATPKNLGGHSRISDPTAQKALKECEPLAKVYVEYGCATNNKRDGKVVLNPELWLKVVVDTKTFYRRTIKGELIRRRYEMHENRNETCKALQMNVRRYHYLVDEIINKALSLGA